MLEHEVDVNLIDTFGRSHWNILLKNVEKSQTQTRNWNEEEGSIINEIKMLEMVCFTHTYIVAL